MIAVNRAIAALCQMLLWTCRWHRIVSSAASDWRDLVGTTVFAYLFAVHGLPFVTTLAVLLQTAWHGPRRRQRPCRRIKGRRCKGSRRRRRKSRVRKVWSKLWHWSRKVRNRLAHAMHGNGSGKDFDPQDSRRRGRRPLHLQWTSKPAPVPWAR